MSTQHLDRSPTASRPPGSAPLEPEDDSRRVGESPAPTERWAEPDLDEPAVTAAIADGPGGPGALAEDPPPTLPMTDPVDQRRTAAPPEPSALSPEEHVAVPSRPQEGARRVPFEPGAVVAGRYRIEQPLASGGMGAVYRATHIGLGSTVALKTLHPELARDTDAVERFRREARIGALVQSAHVVRVHDIDRLADGQLIVVTEFAEQGTLADRVRRCGKLEVREALEITAEVARGLSDAHRAGVVHRDLKPANIMFSGGHAKLIDFGIAKLSEATTRLTAAGLVMGTTRYMAPEQLTGREVGPRADLYALGQILFELITGEPPFEADSLQALMFAKVNSSPRTLAEATQGQVPPALSELVGELLATAPGDRPASAEAVGARIETLLREDGGGTPAAESSGPVRATESIAPRFPRRAVGIGALAAILLSGAILLLVTRENGESPGPPLAREVAPADVARPRDGSARTVDVATPAEKVVAREPDESPTRGAPALPDEGVGGGGLPSRVVPAMPPAAVADEPAQAPPSEPARGGVGDVPTVHVLSRPAAEVFLGGARIGKTPYDIELRPAVGKLSLELRADGYRPRKVELDVDVLRAAGVRQLEYDLTPRRPARDPSVVD